MGLMQSLSFASRAVGQLLDVDHTTLVPTRCSQYLNFLMDLTVQFIQEKSTLLLTFWPIKGLIQDRVCFRIVDDHPEEGL